MAMQIPNHVGGFCENVAGPITRSPHDNSTQVLENVMFVSTSRGRACGKSGAVRLIERVPGAVKNRSVADQNSDFTV